MINLENTKDTFIYELENGEKIELKLTQEQMEEIKKQSKRKTGYERVSIDLENYFTEYTSGLRNIGKSYVKLGEYDYNSDRGNYESGNYYSDEDICKNNTRADSLLRNLRRFSAESGGSEIDWENTDKPKYYIEYLVEKNRLEIGYISIYKKFGIVYFISKEIVEKAIEKFEKELIWYFTEYQWVLK